MLHFQLLEYLEQSFFEEIALLIYPDIGVER